MLSKNKQKYLRSLAFKKHRDADNCFIAEGPKVVEELLPHFHCCLLAGTADFLARHADARADATEHITQQELEQVSSLKTPREAIAVFRKKEETAPRPSELFPGSLCLALDSVQDPGNLGTIVRLADWFGVDSIFCSPDCADAYSPKTVQATMGALARVHIYYIELHSFLSEASRSVPVYGTFLEGENIYEKTLTPGGILVMGNEGKGISPRLAGCIRQRLLIPNYPAGRPTSESLNVAVATAVACAEFRRQALTRPQP